jgi:hypothetical protein
LALRGTGFCQTKRVANSYLGLIHAGISAALEWHAVDILVPLMRLHTSETVVAHLVNYEASVHGSLESLLDLLT